MLWFIVWVVLVLGAVAFGFVVVRHTYRSGKALVLELDRASQTMDELARRSEELSAQIAALHPVEPVNLDDPVAARLRHDHVTSMNRAARELRREARNMAAMRRWLSFTH